MHHAVNSLTSDSAFGNLPPATGIGLKPEHYSTVQESRAIPSQSPAWLEVHPQNYFGDGGPPHRWLTAIAETYPVSFHSVGLSLGSADGLNEGDLEKLAALCERYDPAMVSDHLSFSGNAHDRFADLLPIPYTNEALDHFARQIDRVQSRLKRKMLIENPSRYLAFADDEMDEVEFIARLVGKSGCGIIFDINNVEVSSSNLGLCAEDYIDAVDPAWVGEIHLAGHSVEKHDSGPLRIDDHGSIVSEITWKLFERFIARAGVFPVLIEWDTDIPAYDVLMAEAAKAQAVLDAQSVPQEKHHALTG
ncbi:MAG: DUF692 domain-containing protein [Sphingorhabdus sp.]